MAFKTIVGTGRTTVNLPWANELVQSNPELVGKVWDVLCVKLKPKGMIVECAQFGGWYFKSSDQYKFLVPYLEQWHESKQNNPVLQMQLVATEPYFVLGEDDERTSDRPWTLDDTTFCQVVNKSQAQHGMNLTMPNVPSTSEQSNAHEELDELADKRANQHRGETSKKKPPEEPPAAAVVRR